MGHSRRLSSKPSNLSESCSRRLDAYSLAATAASLGLLALAPRADAKIVYTPANLPLMNQQQVFFDLNHDGINDFSFYGQSISRRSISTFFFRLTVSPAKQGNAIWGVESHEHASCAAPLQRGTRVGPKRPFQANRVVLFDSSGGPDGGTAYCPWGGKIRTAYLGLKFSIKGKTHFGWARVRIASMYPYKVFLTGYAYETIANKPIVTGKTKGPTETANAGQSPTTALNAPVRAPATVGMLALGWPALSIWRRQDAA
ncbi:MAG TPA: hypothetical protein VN950_09390 [Terriglobales bacterium]|nr:hypothetical protein [Terriglobales bacterium]